MAENLRDWVDSIKDAKPDLMAFEKFHDNIQHEMLSLDSTVKTHDSRINELKARELEIRDDPEMKANVDWSGDIWYILSEALKPQLDLREETDAIKDIMLEAYYWEVENLKKVLEDQKQQNLGVAKIEAEKDLMEKFMGTANGVGWSSTQLKNVIDLSKEMLKGQVEQYDTIMKRQESLILGLVSRVTKLEETAVFACDNCKKEFTSLKDLEWHKTVCTQKKPEEKPTPTKLVEDVLDVGEVEVETDNVTKETMDRLQKQLDDGKTPGLIIAGIKRKYPNDYKKIDRAFEVFKQNQVVKSQT